MIRLFAVLLCLTGAAVAQAEPVAVSAAPIASFQRFSAQERFGPLVWRGGLTLTSDDPWFGGFSGLVMSRDCEELLAVSDYGVWLRARLSYDGNKLSGIADAQRAVLLDSDGQPLSKKIAADAEALARLDDGSVTVGFERLARIGRYNLPRDGFGARFEAVPHPGDIDKGPNNGEFEALGELADGRLIAISERQFDDKGAIRAWAWKGRKTTAFTVARFGDYRVTDLAVLDDGSILTLERRFEPMSLPGIALRRFPSSAIARGAVIEPELLLEATAPLSVIDNMEGIAVCERGGTARVTLISDDNFNYAIQSTILLQFDYDP